MQRNRHSNNWKEQKREREACNFKYTKKKDVFNTHPEDDAAEEVHDNEGAEESEDEDEEGVKEVDAAEVSAVVEDDVLGVTYIKPSDKCAMTERACELYGKVR